MNRLLRITPLLGSLAASAAAQNEVTWHTDLETARHLAAEQGKPLFVVFRCLP